jgi:hypothetical protein
MLRKPFVSVLIRLMVTARTQTQLYTRCALGANLLKILATEDTEVTEEYLIKSFCGGPGGGFFKKSPLAAGGQGLRKFWLSNIILI